MQGDVKVVNGRHIESASFALTRGRKACREGYSAGAKQLEDSSSVSRAGG